MFNQYLSHPNPFLRKACSYLLQVSKYVNSISEKSTGCGEPPPVLANSFPKSGTHLLAQVLSALPNIRQYGTFHSSLTNSFFFRQRSTRSLSGSVRRLASGELARAHIFYSNSLADALLKKNTAHFFIYRDPRDVVVSEAHYLKYQNTWHRLHPYFQKTATFSDAVMLAIHGLPKEISHIFYPDVGKRFSLYEGWISHPNCFSLRYEDLRSNDPLPFLLDAVRFYNLFVSDAVDPEDVALAMKAAISPASSHTFRSGETGQWRSVFTPDHRKYFAKFASDALIRGGYEKNDSWSY